MPSAEGAEGGPAEDGPFAALAACRTLFVHGPLDTAASNELVAQVLALDALSPEPITLLVNSPGGPLEDLTPLVDVLSIAEAPVGATCLGEATGTAAVLVACATGRRFVAPRARLSLRLEPLDTGLTGTADELGELAAARGARLDELARLLSRVTALDEARARRELHQGPTHDATTAVALGLADEVRQRRP